MSESPARYRRYMTSAHIEALLRAGYGHADVTPTGARTFNLVTLASTDWVIVPDDDPRVGTMEKLTDGTHES